MPNTQPQKPLITLPVNEWIEIFKPRMNPRFLDEEAEGFNLDIQDEWIYSLHNETDQNGLCLTLDHIWTIVEGDYSTYIVNGYVYVNRVGYLMCDVARDEGDVFFEVDVKKFPGIAKPTLGVSTLKCGSKCTENNFKAMFEEGRFSCFQCSTCDRAVDG